MCSDKESSQKRRETENALDYFNYSFGVVGGRFSFFLYDGWLYSSAVGRCHCRASGAFTHRAKDD